VALRLDGRKCLVVGGGGVALRKVRGLLEYGGRVTVVAPVFCDGLLTLGQKGEVLLLEREYGENEAADFDLVIAAVDREEVNRRVFEDCRENGILVNVVDDPERCDFILSATVKRGPLTLSVGTQGTAPFLARWARERLEEMVPGHWESMAVHAGAFRKAVLADTILEPETKYQLFRRFLETDWEKILKEGGESRAEEEMRALLAEGRRPGGSSGFPE